ncbi:retroviral-like aspartic protease [Wenzhouxiangella sp. XN79A]|uniref:retropepsin-like aspartic protease n=1 Tax=Wenzhouxiangella sp. XN79A TaxID=2724193 RepID=UPI00144AF59F|nr:retropepsin-like aspartic protease [Wenzhouxiangella sp. XN79A]NKI34354.1 retroviral-like aspartic protease [Wenzhouxiangella sp. XN79A]
MIPRRTRWVLNPLTLLLTALQAAGFDPALHFERSPYGLLFTEIEVAGEPVPAMIDFGDPYVIQLADGWAAERDLALDSSGKTAMDTHGNPMELLEGRAGPVRIGPVVLAEAVFGSIPGEIERVAEQVGTPFRAAVGWGFFGERAFVLDYANGRIAFREDDCAGFDAEAAVDRIDTPTHLVTEIRIADQPVRVLVDTGSPIDVIDADTLQRVLPAGGRRVLIEHSAGTFPGVEVDVAFGAVERPVQFEAGDLSVLEPLGAEAILGGTFLRQVELCHAPERGQVRIRQRDAGALPSS